MIDPAQCHGRLSFPTRPAAGTSPWDWWFAEFHGRVTQYMEDLGTRWAEVTWTSSGPLIRFHYRLTDRERATAVAHEMHHLAIGGVCRGLCPRNEAKVVRETARWLIPDVERMATLLCQTSVQSAAKDLGDWVGPWTIRERFRVLTAREQAIVDEVFRSRAHRRRPECRAALPALAACS